MPVDPTHDPALRSWITSANTEETDFPIQNLPLCVYQMREPEVDESEVDPVEADDATLETLWRQSGIGVRVGDQILSVRLLAETGMLKQHIGEDDEVLDALSAPVLNHYAALPRDLRASLREGLVHFLREAGGMSGQQARRMRAKAALDVEAVELLTPFYVGDYTDFYASKHHATNVGSMFRPDNPLLPNYVHVPIGYHGRASSVILSGDAVVRPMGQTKADGAEGPTFGPCGMLDYEMELGLVVGPGNGLGAPVPISRAREHMLGVCILNDWSARDVQKWEYQPLGPFLAKNFATTISPYVVTMEALEPFRVPGPKRDQGDPQPLQYLRGPGDGALDITVEVWLRTAAMREQGQAEQRLSRANAADLFWTFDQLVAHHTSNGCNLMPCDLLGSGTISGGTPESRGCLLELTWGGTGKPRTPIELPTGERRVFLEDGDEVIMRAYAQREGRRRIGFGECRGTVLAAGSRLEHARA